jgi:hypothetical protein
MFGWLFGKKKTEVKVAQDVNFSSNRNRVTQTTNVVNQRGAKASGDIVGGNKYSTYRQKTYTSPNDPISDLFNPINPLSPLNPIYQSDPTPEPRSHSHSYDSGSSRSHSYDSSSSSSYDSGSSSSYDSSSSSSD